MIYFFPVCVEYFVLFTGDTVFVRGPFPQVYESASLRAERPEFISVPGRFFFTYRAGDSFVFHVFVRNPFIFHPVYFRTYAIGTSTHPCTEGIGAARYTARIEAVSNIS